jgi:hypothetical protein
VDGRRVKATRYGTSRRSTWGTANKGQVRLRPQAIYDQVDDLYDGDPAMARELLQRYGYVTNSTRKSPARASANAGKSGGGSSRPPTAAGHAGGGRGGEPPARRGLLGPEGPDEFPEFNGWRPPVKRSEIDAFTEDQAEVLLDGDGTPGGHGYHRFGLGIKSDEFPEGWGVPEVMQWVHGITDHPTWGRPTRNGFVLYGAFNGVEGAAYVRREHGNRWSISTAHPQRAVDWNR